MLYLGLIWISCGIIVGAYLARKGFRIVLSHPAKIYAPLRKSITKLLLLQEQGDEFTRHLTEIREEFELELRKEPDSK